MDDTENHLIQSLPLSNNTSMNTMSFGHSIKSLLAKSSGRLGKPNQPENEPQNKPRHGATREIEVKAQSPITSNGGSPMSGLNGPLLPPIHLDKAANKDRQYGELLVKYNNLLIEFKQMEQDINIKNKTINGQLEQISNYEKFLTHVKSEFGKTKELMEKELLYYKEMIEDYQLKFLKLNNELEYYKKLEFNELESCLVDGDDSSNNEMDAQYSKLLKDFKILKSNFDIEQNSKIVLMDQIEFLSKEVEALKSNQIHNHSNDVLIEENIDDYNFTGDESVIHDLAYDYNTHSTNFNEDDEVDMDGFSDGEEFINNQPQSSPMKDMETPRTSISNNSKRIPSLIQTKDFQFPPSPDPTTKDKRQSLPLNLNTDFVLSPLKLASQDPDYVKHNRYSISRPNHNRYSSHDIVPIQVEFENTNKVTDQRSTSVPSPIRNNPILLEEDEDEKELELDNTFKKLIGEPSVSTENLNINTTTTTTNIINQSTRSSLLFEDHKGLNSELTKQEIMKLKFELRSLKLHNEKLLSYIGFELQKQKKNIRKLKSRQNLEYSDSKLIERSKELLIQKKRVLRSVSINAILSKNYNNKDNIKMLQKGILNFDNEQGNEFDDYEDDEDEAGFYDDYGFLNYNDKFSNRIFSNGLNDYYDIDDDARKAGKNLKKFKSQNFTSNYNADLFDTSCESIDEDSINSIDDCEWEGKYIRKNNNKKLSRQPKIGLFSQIKYLITGNYKVKADKPDNSVDDSLKYQFVSIAIGILIIGIRFGHYNPHNVN